MRTAQLLNYLMCCLQSTLPSIYPFDWLRIYCRRANDQYVLCGSQRNAVQFDCLFHLEIIYYAVCLHYLNHFWKFFFLLGADKLWVSLCLAHMNGCQRQLCYESSISDKVEQKASVMKRNYIAEKKFDAISVHRCPRLGT